MGPVDFLKLGVFLLGISALILASIALHFYLTQPRGPYERFWAYCNFNTVIIRANEDLRNVSVLDVNGSLICNFDEIPKGSDRVCRVGGDGVYRVISGREERAVVCIPIAPKQAPGGD
jgi:hypothetical protein